MKMKSSLTIIGSCVSNQIIRVAAGGKNRFLLKGVTTLLNPFSIGSEVIPFAGELQSDYVFNNNDMHNASVNFDIMRDYSKFCRGNWLMIDIVALNKSIFEIYNDTSSYYLSAYPLLNMSQENKMITTRKAEEKGYKVKFINNPLLDINIEKQYELMKKYADMLLSVYNKDNIIFNRANYALGIIFSDDNTYYDSVYDREHYEKMQERHIMLEDALIKYLDLNETNIIPAPQNMISSDDPLLHAGASPTHYIKETYEYGYDFLNLITDGLPEDELLDKKAKLHKEYIETLESKYNEAMMNSCNLLLEYKQHSALNNRVAKFCEQSEENHLMSICDYYNKRYVNGIEIRNINNFVDYIDYITKNKCSYILLLAVKDTNGNVWKNWEKWTNASLLGLKADFSVEPIKSYSAIVDLSNGKVIEATDSKWATSTYDIIFTDEKKTYSLQDLVCTEKKIESFVFRASSGTSIRKDNNTGASLYVNNIDYSINQFGLNAVLFSLEDKCVIDSFYVDIYREHTLNIKRHR